MSGPTRTDENWTSDDEKALLGFMFAFAFLASMLITSAILILVWG